MKHFIQFDENGEVQFVIKAEFEAVIPDEQKDRFIEVSLQKAEEVKAKIKEFKVADGKLIKKPPEATKPAENALQPIIDQ
ncbi:MAG: hypothetical protein UW86_C0011G0011 [Microgenomates group bacterium GW2011_GWA1_Microgenomates_45_10]|nr:MAG: hypothetical protein UW86_C0011G0011 [Microgenomates group bacterium GW2011_GWA1_Microgenomates_45_10]KKT97405.1 MAG: hypothetical protein UX00_C0011G0017 [Microgenomates group bacterium GW2011_GWB1_45_17]KKU28895.1 MAG: hypothetical protein UX42_C0006G0047 [Microgenomates group bacterium GW2011_GWC1_46_20]